MPKILLEAFNIEKYYSDNKILSFESLKIYSGDKIGVVGANGSGKTTLLHILSGNLSPDSGSVKRYCDLSFIHQFENELDSPDSKLLKEFSSNKPLNSSKLSGGEKARLAIASALSNNSMLVFADEPTSNLDLSGIQLFCNKMEAVESFVLVCHDRNILDALCNKIIVVKGHTLEFFNGNYSSYLEENEKKQKNDLLKYENYLKQKEHLETALTEKRTQSKKMLKAPKRMGNSEARLHKGTTTERRKKLDKATSSIKTRLEKLEVHQKPKELPVIKMDFSLTDPPQNKIVVRGNKLNFSYSDNIIFDDVSFIVKNCAKVALHGENGSGKTTLLNLIANGHKDINVVPKAKFGYFYQGFENIDFSKTVFENVAENSVQSLTVVRTILARLLFKGDNVNKPASVLSGGERIKLSFAKLLTSDANILLLDEPTNYLDIQSIEVLQSLLMEYEGTIIFVSHDKEFVNTIADNLLVFKNKKLISFDGNIDAYENSLKEQKSGTDIEKAVLQLRLTEMISKLSIAKDDKEALETEYESILQKIRAIEHNKE